MTWSIWVGSSIWIKFRKLDVSIQMYTTNKQNIDYQLTKMRKYLTNHPPQKDQRHLQQPKSSTTISSPPSPNKNAEKKVTIFLGGFGCGFPEAPSPNHFPWIPVSAQVTALVKSMRRVLNLGVPPPTEKTKAWKNKGHITTLYKTYIWVFPNNNWYPQIIHSFLGFSINYKPSILGYFWKTSIL